jgi:hypothetical protein
MVLLSNGTTVAPVLAWGRAASAVVATVLLGCSPCRAATACPTGGLFPSGTGLLDTVLVYTGADGVSHLKAVKVKGVVAPFLKSGQTAIHTALGPAERVTLTEGPPNAEIPIRAGSGRVLFLILKGSSTVVLPDGSEMTATPGMLVAIDDTASRTGHGGRSGPCGYVALSLAVPDGAPILAEQKEMAPGPARGGLCAATRIDGARMDPCGFEP